MFFQEATPNTSGYMIAGYAIAFLVMALYVASIYLRKRNLDQDMTILKEMEKPAQPIQTGAVGQMKRHQPASENNRSAKPVTKRARKK
jgi:hypothetical protein